MLNKLHYTPFTTNQLAPTGWLYRQLEIQAKGLSGNLDKIWPDIRDSKWVGGDKEGWERVPYWLDGFIPLAYLLDDEDMKKRAQRYIDAILEGQHEDGWLCPCEKEERARYDMWALFLICKVLVVYHDCTGDERIEDVLYKALYNLTRHIESHTIFNWAAARWYECLISILWLYERRPEAWMVELCHKIEEQGIDYEKTYKNWRYSIPHEHERWSIMTHVVNTAMMLKSRALFSRISGEEPNRFAKHAIRILMRDHGMASEHFTGDECLSGDSPIQGAELCSVAEAMYSYQWLAAITGDSEWSDRLEKAAFNAFPATNSPDMWTHQYNQMTNQVECSVLKGKNHFRTNSADSHLFGLEPNFGCCTANFNQAWPKFALSTMMAAADGIAITAIAPCKLTTSIRGVEVIVDLQTNYPFEDGYKVIIETSSPIDFTLYLRIPGSAKAANIQIAGSQFVGKSGFMPIKRKWESKEEIIVSFVFEAELKERPKGMACLWRGPLLYALPIKEEWQMKEYTKDGVERKFPYCDYEVYPKSRWNYAFKGEEGSGCNEGNEGNEGSYPFTYHGVGEVPFNSITPPCTITAELVEIDWPFEDGVCQAYPTDLSPRGEPVEIDLIPYGCTNLRMTEMPKL